MALTITSTDSPEIIESILAAEGKTGQPAEAEPTETPAPADEKAAKEPEPVEKAEAAVENDDESDDDDENEAVAEPTDEDASKAAKTLQQRRGKSAAAEKRIKKLLADKATLVNERTKTAEERDATRAELERIKAELEALKQGATPKEAKVEAAEQTGIVREKPKEDDFGTYSEYTEALADWIAEQKAAKLVDEKFGALRKEFEDRERARQEAEQQAKQQAEIQARQDAFNARVAKAKELYDDYDDVIADAAELELNMVVLRHMHTSDLGPNLAYHFATHPEAAAEVNAIAQQDPSRALVWLGRLEHVLDAQGKAEPEPQKAGPKVPVSKAPKPMPQVGSGAASPAPDMEKMSHAEFKEFYRKKFGRA